MSSNGFEFHPGKIYPHLTGEYTVEAVEGDTLACRLDDGRLINVSAAQAYRILEETGYFSASDSVAQGRLTHECEGRPCGPACVKLRGSEGA